ncbi:MAG: PIN domain-containing protein [Actinomycetota bacterium]
MIAGAPAPKAVVFDVNVFVGAVVGGNSPFRSWPSPPPVSGNPFADCVGIANDAREFSLWLSEHILFNVVRVLCAPNGFGWDLERAEEYAEILVEIADASGGGVVDPEVGVSDCPDHEDNRILEAALAVGADLIVSEDADLTEMSPWRGIPVIRPHEFASRADAARRAVRRPGERRRRS